MLRIIKKKRKITNQLTQIKYNYRKIKKKSDEKLEDKINLFTFLKKIAKMKF
jgi:hypothetical protein